MIPTLPVTTMRLPGQLRGLQRMAYDIYWSWHPQVRALFSRVDRAAWRRFRSPVAVLQSHTDWSELLDDTDFLVQYRRLLAAYDEYRANGKGSWFARHHADELDGPIAYFCAEFGLHESLGIYSGGLGILAGDHLKAASDLALPFVGVGLFYRHGYFRQTIDADGHQEHAYPDLNVPYLPLQRVADHDGDPLVVPVELPGRTVQVAVWLVEVGRVPLLLLDTDTPLNDEEDRPITHILYVRGREMRLHQELVLGVGGVRALRALGIQPAAWHLNEGHSAFLLVERARELVARGMLLEDALAEVRRRSVFTIHTPVSAGNERFDADLVRRVASPFLAPSGVDIEHILEMGRGPDGDPAQFDMTGFSLRTSNAANAVSQLHAETANATWRGIIHQPILGITNGYIGPCWADRCARSRPHRRRLDYRTRTARDRFGTGCPGSDSGCGTPLEQKLELACSRAPGCARSGHGTARPMELAGGRPAGAVDPDIGFARRFANYSARTAVHDEERLARCWGTRNARSRSCCAGKAIPRPSGPGCHPAHLRAQPVAPVQGAGDGHGGLRHPHRPLPGAGRGRLAQQHTASAGGLRHERHEGCHERRRQLLRARRLVGRGLDGRQRLGHRGAGDQPRRGRPGLGRRAGAQSSAGTGDRAALVRPRCRGSATPLDRHHAQVHGLHGLAVLHRADARGVRGADVPACGVRRGPTGRRARRRGFVASARRSHAITPATRDRRP